MNGKYDLNVTLDGLRENSSALLKASSSLESMWKNTLNKTLSTIENSWMGKDCQLYIENLRSMDKKINNSVEALRMISKAYERVIQEIEQQSASITQKIEYGRTNQLK